MNPQEQAKTKAPFENQPAANAGVQQKNDQSKPLAQDKNRKASGADSDVDSDKFASNKGSCGTK